MKKLLLVLLLFPSMAFGTDYYLDSGVTGGTHVGTEANPACSIYNIWSAINTDLNAATNVTVYLSARNASSDTPDIYTGNSSGGCSGGGNTGMIDMGELSTMHAATLTFNGHSKYNTSDSVPSWTTYSGTSKAEMYSIFAQNISGTHHSKYVIDGIRFRPLATKAISICGDHVRVTNSDVAAGAGATDGLGILIVPTADSAHEGSSESCPTPMTDVEIDNTVLHNTWGETIYVGGGGCRHADATGLSVGSGATFTVLRTGGTYTTVTLANGGTGYTASQRVNVRGNLVGGNDDSDDVQITVSTVNGSGTILTFTSGGSCSGGSCSGTVTYTAVAATNNCQGFPAHSDIRIHDNEFYFTGYIGAENDGVDIKGGLRGMRVYNNYFHDFIYFNMIVSQGESIADAAADNWFYNNRINNNTPETAAIKFSNTWGTPRGVYAFNNLISNSGQNYMMLNTDGVRVYGCSAPFYFANNVLYNNSEAGFVVTSCDGGTFKNNAALANGTGFFATGTPTSTNNAYDSGWTLCTSCQSGLTSADFVNAAGLNFNIAPGSTKLIDTAADLTSLGISALDFDFAGTARPSGSAWDAGAYESASTTNYLDFTTDPTTTVSGNAISTVVVTVKMPGGATDTSSTASITISVSACGTVLGGTTTGNAVMGVKSFTNLIPTGAGTSCTLTATASMLTSGISTAFNVTAVTVTGNGLPMPFAPAQFLTSNGKGPASRYRICTYAAGTTKILPTYATVADALAGTNPIVPPRTLDDAGRLALFLGDASYKFVLHLADGKGNTCNGVKVGSAIWTEDNIRTSLSIVTLTTLTATTVNASTADVGTLAATNLVSTNITDPLLVTGRVVVAGTAGKLGGDTDLTFSGSTLTATKIVGSGAVTAATVTDSALTAGRVPIASTAGLLADDADLTFADDTLTVAKLKTTQLSRTSADLTLKTTTSGNITLTPVAAATAATTVNSRFEQALGTTIVSSACSNGDCTIPGNGNFFLVSGTTTIDGLSTAGIQAGTEVILKTLASITLTNSGTVADGFAPMKLIAGADVAMTSNDLIRLLYDGAAWNQLAPVLVK